LWTKALCGLRRLFGCYLEMRCGENEVDALTIEYEVVNGVTSSM